MRDALLAEDSLAAALAGPEPPALMAPLVAPPLRPEDAAGLDLILEGFLLHHGRPRHLEPAGRGDAVLAGDYCYAQGLIRVAAAGDLFHIRALADLIALSAALVAAGERPALAPLWRATAAAIASPASGNGDGPRDRYRAACALLRASGTPAGVDDLHRLAADLPPTPELSEALA